MVTTWVIFLSINDQGKDGSQAPCSCSGASDLEKKWFYEFQTWHDQEGSPDVVTNMLKVFNLKRILCFI